MTKRITIFDYGAGNLHSLTKALDIDGVQVTVESNPIAAIQTDLLVLPGVGAFSHAADRLAPGRREMQQALLDGLPALGICLGMQLLFEKSEEGPGKGLGVIAGSVRRLRAERIPHIGWNTVDVGSNNGRGDTAHTKATFATGKTASAWATLPPAAMMYFANSYVCDPNDSAVIAAYTTHESDRFVSAVATANTIGVQFHPEKSSTTGLEFVRTIAKEAVR